MTQAAPVFATRPAPGILFRVARKPLVWSWTDLKYAGGGRWDDPQRRYAVLYASGDAFGALLETLSPFQPDLALVAQLKQVRKNARGLRSTPAAGRVPAGWRAQRLLGRGAPAELHGEFVVVGSTATLAVLRSELASLAISLDIPDIDAGVIRLDYSGTFRAFTQAVSRLVFESPDEPAGIFYLGQNGDEVENYAIFRRSADHPVKGLDEAEIAPDDPDFLRACEVLGVEPR